MPKGIYARTQEYINNISGFNNHFYGRSHTAEAKQKISLANKGRNQSQIEKQQRRKAHLGKKYKPMSEEGRRNISKAHMGLTYPTASKIKKGKRYSPKTEFKKGLIPWIKGKHHKKESNLKNRYAHMGLMAGKKHWNWKGGVTPEEIKIRNSNEYKKWQLNVYKRDGGICQLCRSKCLNTNIIAHHIKNFTDHPNLKFDLNNGVTLCRSCHIKLHLRS